MKHPYIALVSLLLLPSLACAATYQWKDQDGNTVYSQFPPEAGREVRTVAPPPPPALPPEQAQQELEALQRQLDELRESRQQERQKQGESRAQTEARAENCRKVRENLRNLEQNPQRLVRESNGDYRRYTEEQRNEKIREYRDILQRDCN
jgi:hypothetical protein